ncbi:hypothetical protein [Streptomyces antarcticus]|uniref:hypothetical protein n=1 Tax=Streptomyces antarcticus TaxID=2996458 RepID=UPI0022714EE1|nr:MULTISPECIES: hypothetical protein [unclassified Streptomyces]MCY0947583.1 hypothetical protein [Streptomyces sp. H34-AA3]MCY0949402.1 hypothetical protein [Streptomyces sp. H27-S2]MCZ4087547.1 hypothetical protein [Streptomyces sp. H34-S5]
MVNPTTDPGGAADFRPTHVVPQNGLPAWETPDESRPTAPLDPFLPVQLLSRRAEWGEILCANGWSAWVDGRLLVAVPQPPPTTGGRGPGRAEDPRPLLARGADALDRYRRAVDGLAAGRADGEGFRASVRGLRAGIVIEGESVWLYDEAAGRWLYGDGTRLATYAVVAGPGVPPEAEADAGPMIGPGAAGGPVGHEPTRLADVPEDRPESRPDDVPANLPEGPREGGER